VKLRLQQLVGGHLFNPSGGTLTPVQTPKMDWLEDFVANELLPNPTTRTLVWCRFNIEVARIVEAVTTWLGPQAVCGVTGSGLHKKENAEIDAIKASFNSRLEDGVQVMVMQTQKMCSGHNLQAGDHHVWYSKPWSPIQYDQACDRSHRQGREGGVAYWHLDVLGTVDEQVNDCVMRKIDLMEGLSPATVSQLLGEE
jgi:SNF2 family DNA or RNA helicase